MRESGMDRALEEIHDLFGKRYSDKLVDRIIYSGDVWPYFLVKAQRISDLTLPRAVVWPINDDEIRDLINIARKYKTPLIPYGGGAGVTGAAMTIKDSIVIDLKKMKKVLEIDEESSMITVETGIIAQHLEDYLNRKGFMFPHYPMSMWTSTIGGFLATRASGILSTKYGNIEDLTLGMKVITGTGDVYNFPPFPKTSSGPDLKKVFIGSEGTLGIITQTTLRIFPLPEKLTFKVLLFEKIEDAIGFMRRIIQHGIKPALMRLYDEMDTALTFGKMGLEDSGNLLLLMFDDQEPIVSGIIETVENTANDYNAKGLDDELGWKWWRERYHKYMSIPDAMEMGIIDTFETVIRWSKLYELYQSIKNTLEENECMVMAHFSHFYQDSAAIYFTFLTGYGGESDPFDNYKKAWRLILERALELGATLSHHHGIGILRGNWLRKELGRSMSILRALKSIFDPDNILNPGKLGLNGVEW